MASFKFKKTVQALNFFARKEGNTINYMKAGKLVYLADKIHLRTYGRTITNDIFVAMKNGPVPSGARDVILKSEWVGHDVVEYSNQFLSRPNGYFINSVKETDEDEFSKTDIKVMTKVYENFGHLDEFQLSRLTHKFPEWLRFEPQLIADPRRAFSIVIEDLFNTDNTDISFAQSQELLDLSKAQFQSSGK